METDKNTYVKFKNSGISIGYRMFYKDEEGVFSAYIPGFDLAYSAPDMETLKKRAEAMIHHFFDYWIGEESWKQFILKLHKLGFRTEMHDIKMKNLLNNKRPESARFESVPQRSISDVFSSDENIQSVDAEKELAY